MLEIESEKLSPSKKKLCLNLLELIGKVERFSRVLRRFLGCIQEVRTFVTSFSNVSRDSFRRSLDFPQDFLARSSDIPLTTL